MLWEYPSRDLEPKIILTIQVISTITPSADHLLNALWHLKSFDHHQCDAILFQRRLEIGGAFYPDKPRLQRDTVYTGTLFAIFWTALAVAGVRLTWLPRNRRTKIGEGRFFVPVGVIVGLGFIWLQLDAVVRYVDTCRRVLPH